MLALVFTARRRQASRAAIGAALVDVVESSTSVAPGMSAIRTTRSA